MSHSPHSQNQPARSAPKNPPTATVNPPGDKKETGVIDSSQGSLELGKHRANDKVAQQPAPEKHVTPHSEEKFQFPMGDASDGKEKSAMPAEEPDDTSKNHHANPSRNTFQGPDPATQSKAATEANAQSGRQSPDVHANHPNVPIKQPNKSTNGS